MFFREFCKIFKNAYFTEHLLTAASGFTKIIFMEIFSAKSLISNSFIPFGYAKGIPNKVSDKTGVSKLHFIRKRIAIIKSRKGQKK